MALKRVLVSCWPNPLDSRPLCSMRLQKTSLPHHRNAPNFREWESKVFINRSKRPQSWWLRDQFWGEQFYRYLKLFRAWSLHLLISFPWPVSFLQVQSWRSQWVFLWLTGQISQETNSLNSFFQGIRLLGLIFGAKYFVATIPEKYLSGEILLVNLIFKILW